MTASLVWGGLPSVLAVSLTFHLPMSSARNCLASFGVSFSDNGLGSFAVSLFEELTSVFPFDCEKRHDQKKNKKRNRRFIPRSKRLLGRGSRVGRSSPKNSGSRRFSPIAENFSNGVIGQRIAGSGTEGPPPPLPTVTFLSLFLPFGAQSRISTTNGKIPAPLLSISRDRAITLLLAGHCTPLPADSRECPRRDLNPHDLAVNGF